MHVVNDSLLKYVHTSSYVCMYIMFLVHFTMCLARYTRMHIRTSNRLRMYVYVLTYVFTVY